MYEQIVVGTDGSDGAGIAVDVAIALARLTGATLHVVTVYRVSGASPTAAACQVGIPAVDLITPDDVILNEARQISEGTVEHADRAGVSAVAHCIAAEAADAIRQVAEDLAADLVVVGNRGMTGVRRFVLGSVPNRLSHHGPTSLLIVDTVRACASASQSGRDAAGAMTESGTSP